MIPRSYYPKPPARRVEIDDIPTPDLTPLAVVRQATDERLHEPAWQKRAAGIGGLADVCLTYWLPFVPL